MLRTMVSDDHGSPPHDPAFLPALLPAAVLDAASCLALSASAASLGRVILWNASFTLVPPSMASRGSFLSLHHHKQRDLAYQWPHGKGRFGGKRAQDSYSILHMRLPSA